MKRRDFITTTGLSVLAISTFGCALIKGNKFEGDCKTTSDILGPFYRPDAPFRSKLAESNLAGDRIQITGNVFTNDCSTTIEHAKIEIWQADINGSYDNESEAFQLRGQQKSDTYGAYGFETILPGRYLNGRKYRPAHYHFRVTAPGHKELISQVYVKGDPYIKSDPWASDPKAELRILEVRTNNEGIDQIRFDIFLDKV